MLKVIFMDTECDLEFSQYGNGRVSIQLWTHEDGFPEPIGRATVNLPMETLEDGCVFIKDYAENSGMLLALRQARIVGKPIRHLTSGYATIPVCKLLVNPKSDDCK